MNAGAYTWPGLWGLGYGAPLNCPTFSYGAPCHLQAANSPPSGYGTPYCPPRWQIVPPPSYSAPSCPCG
jgi:hypothetical protein